MRIMKGGASMNQQEYILELSEVVIAKVSPLELKVFEEFMESFRRDPINVGLQLSENEKADLGFGSGTTPTFLTPWIIYAIKESIAFIRELLAGIIVDRVSKERHIPIAKSSIAPELIRQLKTKVYEKLHSKGIKGREGRRIADEVIDTVLFDSKAAPILFKLLIIDSE